MEYKSCLLDSNVVIDFIAAVLPEKGMTIVGNIINATANISLINKMELLGVHLPDKHIKPFQVFVESANVLEISDEIAEKTIYIRRHHKNSGNGYCSQPYSYNKE